MIAVALRAVEPDSESEPEPKDDFSFESELELWVRIDPLGSLDSIEGRWGATLELEGSLGVT